MKQLIIKYILLLTFTLTLAIPAYASTNFSSFPDLELGMTSSYVTQIQKLLNSNGYIVNLISGQPGSIGYETDYFGEKTRKALSTFQSVFNITPAQGYFGTKTKSKANELIQSGVLKETSLVKNGNVSSSTLESWTPPIGIPAPEFGIKETYRMYDDPTKRNPSLTYTQNAEGGFYTHYVDSTDPNCTPYWIVNNGTKEKPSCTIPEEILAGSVLEVHGGIYSSNLGSVDVTGYASSIQPIFVRGVEKVGVKPYFETKLRVEGTYLIVENVTSVGIVVMGEYSSEKRSTHHIGVRYNDVYSKNKGAGGITVAGGYSFTSTAGTRADQVVVYKNTVHDFGNIQSEVDEDYDGMFVGILSKEVWLIDNTIYNTSGAGIGVLGVGDDDNNPLDPAKTSYKIYLGRNHIYNTRQAGIGIKQSSDVIVSENLIHDIVNTTWSPSKGIGMQYGSERLWVLFNEVYNCTYGLYFPSTYEGLSKDMYIVGNFIHDISLPPGGIYYPSSAWSYAGMMLRGGVNRYVIGNTIYNAPAGINGPSNGTYALLNNIISDVDYGSIFLEQEGRLTAVMENNLLYQPGGRATIGWGGGVYYSLPDFQTATGKALTTIEKDPLLNSDGTLGSTSPAINAGTESSVYQTFQDLYGIDIRVDFDGKPRPQGGAWDIGAFEYGGTTTPPPTTTYTLTTNTTVGGTITGNTNTYNSGTTATLTAVPNTGYSFLNWTGCTGTSGTTCTVLMNSNKTVTANFYLIPVSNTYTLTTTKTGSGTITGAQTSYNSGTTATLTATPDTGYIFTGWSGACTGTGSCTITMDSNKTVSASFTIIPPLTTTYTLTTQPSTGGTITGNTSPYTSGSSAKIIAVPNTGYTLASWTGCTGTSGNICVVTMDSNKTVSANFIQIPTSTTPGKYIITVFKAGTGQGTISGTKTTYRSGTKVSLTARPKAGSVFAGWSGACTNLTGKCVMTITSNRVVTATFNLR